jgi:hypothetical protein
MSKEAAKSLPTQADNIELSKHANALECGNTDASAPIECMSFTRSQRRQLQLLLVLAAITLPLIATIYFPLLPLLHIYFHVSAQVINLTFTLHIVFQAISPVLSRHFSTGNFLTL